ncbi:hypothetical protein [Microvirga sesbaniae]|uniref:hypothetical protein n=1 Tax=Microvirga sesbaniae TaxID=681392 RepID=UPI0021C9EA25|nr:hypothetical protein [Microvirga sp. HBU67692]
MEPPVARPARSRRRPCAVADLAKLGPTSANASPGRFVFVVSREAKERLRPYRDEGNVRQTMSAPATVIVAHDTAFYEKLPALAPNSPEARGWFAGKPEAIERAGFQGSCLQGAYLIMAARARVRPPRGRRGVLPGRESQVQLPRQAGLRHP